MLTTPTPGAQAFNMVNSAAMPPKAAPYPTEVGTAITGAETNPATTPGNAPSIPAKTTITRALRSTASRPSTPCRPATPTSTTSSVARPRNSATNCASRATGRSDVPAHTTTTSPPVGAGGSPGQATRPDGVSWNAPGSSATTASACRGPARVNNVTPGRSRTAAAITDNCWGVFPSQYTASG